MKYLSLDEIRFLNVDINCICNAACPGCARQEGHVYRNPNTPNGEYMSISTWKKIILPLKNYLKVIVLCGNYGEPGASPNLPELIKWTVDACPALFKVQFDSNVGVNNTKFWTKLGKLSKENPHIILHASIDGLEDTNHIYRRFVKWNKVVENLKAYNDAGGKSCWKMIKFPWNSHQHEEAKTLAKELGCSTFEFNITNNDSSPFYDMYKKNKKDWWDREVFNSSTESNFNPTEDECLAYKKDYTKQYSNVNSISCITKNDNGIHANWDGKIWPCCWYGGAIHNGYSPIKELVKYETDYVYKEHWNDVNHFTLEEIMNSPFYTNDLMDNQQTNPSIMCTEVCGKCDDKWNRIHTRTQYSEDDKKSISL
jgi:hypothetical protein